MKFKIGEKIRITGTGGNHSWHGGKVTTGSILVIKYHSEYGKEDNYTCVDIETGLTCYVFSSHQFGIVESKNKVQFIDEVKHSRLINWLNKGINK